MQVLGTESFLSTPDVNGTLVMLNGGGNDTITSGTTAARPAFGNTGNLYVDTTMGVIFRDTGTAWNPLNHVLQVVTGNIPATTGTTTVATALNTVPTIAGGFQIWTTSFTPKSATSRLIVKFTVTASHGNSARPIITSCFAGSTNIGSVVSYMATANVAYPIVFQSVYSPGATTTITISARAGSTGSGTLSIGQYSGTTNTLGGAAVTEYTIMEVL